MDGILETFKRPATTVNQGYVLYPPDTTAVTVDSNGGHGTSVGVGETVSISIDFNEVVVYDKDEMTTVSSAEKISKSNSIKVFYLEGGIQSWTENNLPLVEGK